MFDKNRLTGAATNQARNRGGTVAALFVAALVSSAPALAQSCSTMPPNTVCGRLGVSTGPAQAIPFTTLTGNLLITISGDCTMSVAGVITCTKTNGVAFAASATVNTTSATNITSGTLPDARLSSNVPLKNGTNAFTGNNYFGGGAPWVDVKSGANGCAAAVGDNTNDDTTAIQCQVTWANANLTGGAGTVFFPCGIFKVTATITVPGGVRLQGAGRTCSEISVGNNDIQVLTFSGGSNTFGGMRDIFIVGDNAGGALTKNAVVINANTPVVFENCMIWGGKFALQTAGIDTSIRDCFIMGTGSSGGGITSTGAGWYERVKIDTIGVAVPVGFTQGANAAIMENHFSNSDFSGSFTNSVTIADTNNNAVTVFSGSVFSSPIVISNSKHTSIVGGELGSTTISNAVGTLAITGTLAFTATTATGAGARSCAANVNLTC